MELDDEILIPAPRATVYAALNDPEILKAAIPGCEELTKHSETELDAKVVLKVGPVKARFSGKVTLDPAGAPAHFSLTGEGQGGVAGFAKGGAQVDLDGGRGRHPAALYRDRAGRRQDRAAGQQAIAGHGAQTVGAVL